MKNFYYNNEKVSKKDWMTSLILCWFLGFFGIHRMYSGKIGSGFLMLYGTIVASCILAVDKYLGAVAFVIMGALVVNDFFNILLKCFKDVYGKEIVKDNIDK
jgi:TM2 domain-containing membrane protein YozV